MKSYKLSIRFALPLLFIFTMSCGTATHLERSVTVSFADFRRYAEEGFFVSPDPYSAGPFESLGELYISVTPSAWEKGKKEGTTKHDDGIYSRPEVGGIVVEVIKYDELLDIAVSEAVSLGANGLVDFKITSPPSITPGSSFVITGLCIKRL